MEEMTFSKHALRKIGERKLSEDIVKKVLNEQEFIFYDLLTNAIVAISCENRGDFNISCSSLHEGGRKDKSYNGIVGT